MAFTPRKSNDEIKPEATLESFVTTDAAINFAEARIMVYGPPKVGKTTSAMTVSEMWPADMGKSKGVLLEDTLSIAADREANVGLRALGINVPEFDIRKQLQTGACRHIRDALKKAAEVVDYYVENKGVKNVVVDTVSMIDFELQKYWGSPQNMPISERGEPDKFAMFREILTSHGNFWQDIDFLNARVIFLCHADINQDSVKPKKNDREQAKLQVSLAGTDLDIKPQLTGKSGDLYVKNTSMILAMKLFGEPSIKGSCERKFLPFGGGGMQGGNRFHEFVDAEEPAHLGNLLKKIEAAAKARLGK